MKKIIIIGLMLSLALSAFCQLKDTPKYANGVLSINGDNWVNFNYDTKYGFAIGIFWSFDTTREFLLRTNNDEAFSPLLKETFGENAPEAVRAYMNNLYEWCFFEGNAINIINVLDKAYSYKENRKYQVIEVLLIEYNKAWWKNVQTASSTS